jgi:hypothetical protein
MERVQQDRSRALARARGRSNFGMSEASSSDHGDMEMIDDDEDEELDEEVSAILFRWGCLAKSRDGVQTLRRIMISNNRREQHRQRVSYEEEVGSEMGDADEIEASYGLTYDSEECELAPPIVSELC